MSNNRVDDHDFSCALHRSGWMTGFDTRPDWDMVSAFSFGLPESASGFLLCQSSMRLAN